MDRADFSSRHFDKEGHGGSIEPEANVDGIDSKRDRYVSEYRAAGLRGSPIDSTLAHQGKPSRRESLFGRSDSV